MSTSSRLVGALVISTALTIPSLAQAQDSSTSVPATQPPVAGAQEQADEQAGEDVDISVPGGSSVIVVTGRLNRDPQRNSAQVTSVLSSADIARTGEGDIAGALGRVTGLSVVGSGFVYVRGLGDRYSLALLNGSPLPSPEPLRRVVPLDLFPTSVVASSLVQKSFSANFPGEFGGGVINLTTRSTPDEGFLTIGASLSGDLETTFQKGYSYYGSRTDWLGYDNGTRDTPTALQDYFDSGLLIGTDPVNSTAIARELVTSRQAVVQQIGDVPANWSASLSGGTTVPLGGADLGIIAAANYSNAWQTRDTISQSSVSADLSSVDDFRQVSTNQNLLVNGLVGFGLEFGDQVIRWTNVYIHDTIKRAALSQGQRDQNGNTDFLQQRTGFYERQLIDTQLVGEFEFGGLSLDLRASYANTKRDAPGELYFEYVRTNSPADPFGDTYVNLLNGNRGNANVTYSKLEEDLYSGGADLTYPITDTLNATIGGAYTDTQRSNSRRDFLFRSNGNTVNYPGGSVTNPNFLSAIGTLRPDILLSPGVVDALGITLVENDPGAPVFDAELEVWAGYGKVDLVLGDTTTIDAGVRFESATQTTTPIKVFQNAGTLTPPTELKNDYFLPAVTVTLDIGDGLQFRVSGSKTVARPQFRELINQPFYDPDSNRSYRGNPFLEDSTLINGEARLEWYFARDQRVSLAGFYKEITNPIEAFVAGSDLLTSFANAPKASLYGGELEAQKYIDLEKLGGDFFHTRQLVLIGNYTFTKSELSVGANDVVQVFGAGSSRATDYFRDGAPLTGQSDHLINLQIGLEDLDRLSQQTLLFSYASDRVVSRGLNGTPPQPDVIEKPGIRLDFVWREGFALLGTEAEVKLEARNILGTRHQEFQKIAGNRIDLNTYDVGQTLSAGLSITF